MHLPVIIYFILLHFMNTYMRNMQKAGIHMQSYQLSKENSFSFKFALASVWCYFAQKGTAVLLVANKSQDSTWFLPPFIGLIILFAFRRSFEIFHFLVKNKKSAIPSFAVFYHYQTNKFLKTFSNCYYFHRRLLSALSLIYMITGKQ